MAKPKEINARGNVSEEGVLKITHRREFDEAVRALGKCEVEIVVRKKRRTVSNALRRYYFGVVVNMVMQGLKEMGMRVDLADADEWVRHLILAVNKDVTHQFLKERFIESIIVDEETGEYKKNDMSTKRMTNVEFITFYTPVYQWASEFLGISIPEPNESFDIPDEYKNEMQ